LNIQESVSGLNRFQDAVRLFIFGIKRDPGEPVSGFPGFFYVGQRPLARSLFDAFAKSIKWDG
jgi:hypothetical protein